MADLTGYGHRETVTVTIDSMPRGVMIRGMDLGAVARDVESWVRRSGLSPVELCWDEALRPMSLMRPVGLAGSGEYSACGQPGPWRLLGKAAVNDVVRRRRAAIENQAVHVSPGGRMLAFAPAGSLSDGAASQASGGIFDVANLPGWGLWLAWVRPKRQWLPQLDRPVDRQMVLLSWVPEALVEAADAGVYVNPEGCLGWVDA